MLPINSVAQAYTEQQQRQANIGDTQANTLQRLMQVAIGNWELQNAQRQQQSRDEMRNYLMREEAFQAAAGNPNATDPNAQSLAATQAATESPVEKSVRELTAKDQYYSRALRQAMILDDPESIKQFRMLADNNNTQLREARQALTTEQRKVADDIAGLAFNASGPDDLAHLVLQVDQLQGRKAALGLAAQFRSDPNDPSKFLFGDQEKAALARVVAGATKVSEQAQAMHWQFNEQKAAAEFADRQRRTESLIAERDARTEKLRSGIAAGGKDRGNLGPYQPEDQGKPVSIELRPEGSPVSATDLRQMQNDIAFQASGGLPPTGGSAATAAAQPLKSVEYIYPRKEDGSIDVSKGPIGTRGVTRDGKLVVLDAQGNPTTLEALGGGTEKERKATTISLQNATRNRLVQGAAKNAMERLSEIEKLYPNENASILISMHPEGLTESLVAAGIRSNQSKRQQQVDSHWRSFIDEAIPVFTGGLRGSDAFRRFLISQAPNMGAKNNAQIIDLFRKNIQGMDTAFANMAMSAYSSDPKFWGTRTWDGKPVTKEDVDAALQYTQERAAGAAAKSNVMQQADKILEGK